MSIMKKISAVALAGILASGTMLSFKAEPATALNPGEVKAVKDLERDKDGNPKQNPDGSYNINLSVVGKNTTKKITHADVIFIATHSRVHGTSITQSHKDFIKKVIESGEGNKVGVVTNCASCRSQEITNNIKELNSYLDSITGNWTAETYEKGLSAPLNKAIETLNQRQDKTRPAYVFITGIKPGLNDIKDPKQIEFLKMNRTHTILMGPEASKEANAFRNYGDVECVDYNGDLNAKVGAVLNKWADEMFIKPAKAGTQAVMTDTVNTEVFDYSVESKEIQDNGKGILKWNIGDIPETEKKVTFKVTPKPGKFGTFKTNNDVILDYLDVSDKPAKKLKEEIGDPELILPEYTVTYTDGVDKYEIFKDEVYRELGNGSPTPKFKGKTSQKGWTFKGWTPEVTDTVTGNITYTAQWEEPVELTVTYTDGVDNENIFEDVKYSNLREGDKTPNFTTDKTKVDEMNVWLKENFKAPRDYFDSVKPDPKPDNEQQGTAPNDGDTKPVEKLKSIFRTLTDSEDGNQKPETSKPEIVKEEPKRDGYEFKGWTPEVTETLKSSVTYTAQWEKIPTYKVTYTDGVDNETIFEDKVFSDLRIDADTPKFGELPNRVGYLFKGWSPEVSEKVKGDATYVAQWEVIPENITYTVTYTDGVEGETIFEDKVFSELKPGETTPEFGNNPTRNGYTFEGWTPKVSETVTGDVTYTAQWKAVPLLPKTGVVVTTVPILGVIASSICAIKKYF